MPNRLSECLAVGHAKIRALPMAVGRTYELCTWQLAVGVVSTLHVIFDACLDMICVVHSGTGIIHT